MVMNYTLFHLEKHNSPVQVEEDSWEMVYSPEQFGLTWAPNGPEDRLKVEEIADWCHSNGIWAIADMVYFNTREERTAFILQWA
jgi:hypothetical protein